MRILIGSAAAMIAALLAGFLVVQAAHLFLALLVLSGFGLAAATLVYLSTLSVAQAGAAAIALALILSLAVPLMAFRLVGRLKPAPPTTVNLSEAARSDPNDKSDVARRIHSEDHYATALYAALSVVVLTGVLTLAHERRSTGLAYGGVVCLTFALPSSSPVRAVATRLLGQCGRARAVWRCLAVRDSASYTIVMVVVTAAGAFAGLASSVLFLDRAVSLRWGRIADLIASLLAVALIPLGLGAVGLLALVGQLGSWLVNSAAEAHADAVLTQANLLRTRYVSPRIWTGRAISNGWWCLAFGDGRLVALDCRHAMV
jgi:hypothetical protein